MLQRKIITQSWGIGLNDEQRSFLRNTFGEEHELVSLAPGDMQTMSFEDVPRPFALWMASSCGRELAHLPDALARHIATIPRALLLSPGYSLEDFESACDCGVTDILRPPLSRERIADIMCRSLEAHALQYDMECMTREILLERELLERKNEILSFLVGFLADTTKSLDLGCLLQKAYANLAKFLPVCGMHAVLWERGNKDSALVSLHICAPEKSKAHEAWRETLLEHARRSVGPAPAVTEINQLRLPDQKEQWAMPGEHSLLTLPLVCDNESLGLLILMGTMERHLGRDQAMALDSAIQHFSLSVKNAGRFRQMQMFADYDALTGVHSRRHFEVRLDQELERRSRYGETLSMIMLDIDHFKQINDTYGHHVGDIALREIASILARTIRATDYCARYGGEEFVILLPHTGYKKTMVLAERLRKRIAAHTFLADGGTPLNLMVSLGVSSLTGDSLKKRREDLIREADNALYIAKTTGRNRTCVSSQLEAALNQQQSAG